MGFNIPTPLNIILYSSDIILHLSLKFQMKIPEKVQEAPR